ncbi:hypothetical protein BU14_0103s0020 [Porphyra umbilicalis]|uniref:Globin domain-containing protein n=1 Tax=Porphyra umbilicalis TaxID=2786 RepID=A0A1X6PD63_PORUM|nr:hypothetical protein BU14_0103s0020 [Porphyra umbilicalis]|eukprot:OSX78676.1 hypothetical protein BU14_0103s0020 [Porphyra umbilicalis]
MGALSDDTVRIVKSTAPVLKVHGGAIVDGFYALLFEQHPAAAAYFNVVPTDGGGGGGGGGRGQSKAQIQRLSMAVLLYAESIDQLDTLGPVLERISAKHASRGIPAEFYPAVGACLLQSIGRVLGDAATPEIVGAWGEAYGFLADALMATEAKIAAGLASDGGGGWTGYAPFVVASVTKEAVPPPGRAASLVLRPAAGGGRGRPRRRSRPRGRPASISASACPCRPTAAAATAAATATAPPPSPAAPSLSRPPRRRPTRTCPPTSASRSWPAPTCPPTPSWRRSWTWRRARVSR